MPNRPEPGNYYAILGVERTASFEEIRAAFRERAKALHPDKNQGRNTKEEFQLIREAYAVLGHADQRRSYDFRQQAASVETPVSVPVVPPVESPRFRYRFIGVVVPVLALLVLFLVFQGWETRETAVAPTTASHFETEMQAAMTRHAQSFTGLPPEPATYEVTGKGGRKYVLATADYKRLLPLHDRLVTESKDLHRRRTEMDARRADLEKEERALVPANVAAVVDFRRKVDVFNHDGVALRRHLELHAAELEDYFKQIERAAESGR